ncbi:Crp/Fnr family transcriptional regulator [Thalassospiraceae bacterium LMO-JJ14]|nr:Crp/Fnr family transcriptional regulator [Thalassospiraceae bacterium LMO-JJ14]
MTAKNSAPASPSMKFDAKLFLTSVGTGRRSVKYQAKDFIFRQGDAAESVFYIEKGKVQITVVSDQGKEGIIATLGAGQFLGEGCLAGQECYLASAHAVEPTTAVTVDKAAMIRVMHEQPELSEMFMSFLLTRNIRIEADLVDQLFNSSEKRLARALLLLANFGKEGRLETVVPKVSQEDLAATVGTTRARVNFFMNKFRKLGLIEYNGELKVHSALLNIIVHD